MTYRSRTNVRVEFLYRVPGQNVGLIEEYQWRTVIHESAIVESGCCDEKTIQRLIADAAAIGQGVPTKNEHSA